MTSGQPSANPRVVKEAIALNDFGYKVSVLYLPLSPWADSFDEIIFKQHNQIKWIRAGYHQAESIIIYYLARIRLKFYRLVNRYCSFLLNEYVSAFALFSQELSNAAVKIKADLYIGHNIGSLPAIVKAAKKNKGICAFDAEDYHSGEFTGSETLDRLLKKIEDKYFPSMSYISTASPLITKAYQERFSKINFVTINNVFSRKYLKKLPTNRHTERLSLFWFSQKIGADRGLEIIIDAVNLLKEYNISLHILGNCKSDYKKKLINRWQKEEPIEFLNPVEPDEIFTISGQFDIGLASEIPYCINRNICLTNKIFTYLLAGNCIIASDTDAQKLLMEDYRGIGLIYKHNDAVHLSTQIKSLLDNKQKLLEFKKKSLHIAENELNWEIERKKMYEIISLIFIGKTFPY